MTGDLEFGPLPDVTYRTAGPQKLWTKRLDAMRSRPHEWADLGAFPAAPNAMSSARNALRVRGEAEADWQRATRKMPDGSVHMFMRYIGGAA